MPKIKYADEKIKTKKKINTKDALNQGVILLYSPKKHAQKITETIINNYIKIHTNLNLEMEKCLYSVIRILTDAYR